MNIGHRSYVIDGERYKCQTFRVINARRNCHVAEEMLLYSGSLLG